MKTATVSFSISSLVIPVTREECRQRHAFKNRNSVCSLHCLGKKIVPALYRGEEQLSELRRASQGREHAIRLQVGVGAVVPPR